MITEGCWSYDDILEYEKSQIAHLPPRVLEWVCRSFDQKFDKAVRQFIFFNTKAIWDPAVKSDKPLTKAVFNRLLSASNFEEATPYNNFWLRFPDYCPWFPFRQINTADAFEVYCNVSPIRCAPPGFDLFSGHQTYHQWCQIQYSQESAPRSPCHGWWAAFAHTIHSRAQMDEGISACTWKADGLSGIH